MIGEDAAVFDPSPETCKIAMQWMQRFYRALRERAVPYPPVPQMCQDEQGDIYMAFWRQHRKVTAYACRDLDEAGNKPGMFVLLVECDASSPMPEAASPEQAAEWIAHGEGIRS